MTRLPRLLDGSMQEVCRLHPVSLELELNLSPLSTAVMTLPPDDPDVAVGRFIELYTPQGSTGIFRVEQAEQTFTGTTRLHLQHGLVTLADGLIPGQNEEGTTASLRSILTTLLSHQSQWTLGQVDVPDTLLLTWRYDYANLLESLLAIMKELPGYRLAFDQSALPWTLNVRALADDDPNECRLSRNLESLTVETDRSELCTRLYIPGAAQPLEADTIAQYGTVTRSLAADDDLPQEELLARGRQYLEAHKHPQLMVSLHALDLSQCTGESLDRFTLGHPCRVCLPEKGSPILQRVVSIAYPDLIADDQQLRLTLATQAQTTADVLSSLIIDTTVVKKKIVHQAEAIRDNQRLILEAEEAIELRAKEISLISERLDVQARDITVNAENIAANAKNISVNAKDIDVNAENIAANANAIAVNARDIDLNAERITANANAISVNARDIDVNAENIATNARNISVNSQNISVQAQNINANAQSIAANAQAISLKADKIDLQGYVTMQEFEALEGTVNSLFASDLVVHGLSSDYVTAGEGDFDNLVFGTLNGVNTEWKSHYVLTGIGTISQSKRYLNVRLADGSSAALDIVTNVSISPNGTYLNYFGKA